MNNFKNSYDIIENAVINFWEATGYPHDVVVFFYQKYEHENNWRFCSEVVESCSSYEYEMAFLNDFCEGETCVKDIKIVSLREVLEYYAKGRINDPATGD